MHLSPAKVQRVLGIVPEVSFRDGIAREWEWLQANPRRWTTMSY